MSDSDIHDSAYSWFRLAVTLTISAVGTVGIWAIIIVLPLIEADLGVDRAAASLLYTLTMCGFAAGNLVIGRLVDRFGVTWSLMLAAACTAVGFTGAAQAPSLNVLTAWQVLIGFGAAVGFGPLIADVSHWFSMRRGIAVAVAASGNYLSGALWPLALKGVLATDGWRSAYVVIAVTVIAVMVPLALLLLRRVPAGAADLAETAARQKRKGLSLSPRALQMLLALAGLSCCVAMSMPQVHIVSFCVDLGYGPAVGSDMLSLMLLGGVGSRLVSGFVADRLGGVATVLIGSAGQCLALFLYLAADGLTPLYLVSLIFGLAQGGIVPSYAVIVREYLPAREAGTRIGLVVMATILGMAAGGWMSGWIYDMTGSYQAAFLNGIAWNFLNIGVMALIFFNARRRSLLAT